MQTVSVELQELLQYAERSTASTVPSRWDANVVSIASTHVLQPG